MELRVQGIRSRASGLGYSVQGFGFGCGARAEMELRVQGIRFRASGLGLRVQGFGFGCGARAV